MFDAGLFYSSDACNDCGGQGEVGIVMGGKPSEKLGLLKKEGKVKVKGVRGFCEALRAL